MHGHARRFRVRRVAAGGRPGARALPARARPRCRGGVGEVGGRGRRSGRRCVGIFGGAQERRSVCQAARGAREDAGEARHVRQPGQLAPRQGRRPLGPRVDPGPRDRRGLRRRHPDPLRGGGREGEERPEHAAPRLWHDLELPARPPKVRVRLPGDGPLREGVDAGLRGVHRAGRRPGDALLLGEPHRQRFAHVPHAYRACHCPGVRRLPRPLPHRRLRPRGPRRRRGPEARGDDPRGLGDAAAAVEDGAAVVHQHGHLLLPRSREARALQRLRGREARRTVPPVPLAAEPPQELPRQLLRLLL
mmetsp:Transcript_33346/g.94917  ORF Transcript_33346/g.94917 Transcript_33346/m.94917 type:complete len:304 (-) Transcript_33346:224-1135(-)